MCGYRSVSGKVRQGGSTVGRLRNLWLEAQGVPWGDIFEGRWGNPDLFYSCPVGCVVCGNTVQAKGTIVKNTVQNGWGFELWGGSESKELSIKNNCIRGNNPGWRVDDLFMAAKGDMTNNWWGHIDGPYHPTYNPISKTTIVI